MNIRLIRHASMIVNINDKKILIDPMLSPMGTLSPIPHVANKNNNPLVDLPVDTNTILDIDAVLVTHTHRDHFDDAAVEILPKDIPIFCQPKDQTTIGSKGFQNITSIDISMEWNNIIFHRTSGQHGQKLMAKAMGPVSGFVIESPNSPRIYITGDTIWCKDVEKAIEEHNPEIIVCFSGAAQFNIGNPITMTADDIYKVCKKAPNAKIIGVHMESWNHCSLLREDLKTFLLDNALDHQVHIPYDGEIMTF